MTAKELADRLAGMPPDAPIVVRIGSREKEAYDIDFVDGEVIISGT